MSRKVSVQLIDDLDGGPAAHTVSFALDGARYEIDLSAAHAASLRDAIAEFVTAGRRTGSARPRTAPEPVAPLAGSASSGPEQLREMREWARANGFPVSERGRVSREIQDAYHATPADVRAEQAQTFADLANATSARSAESTHRAGKPGKAARPAAKKTSATKKTTAKRVPRAAFRAAS